MRDTTRRILFVFGPVLLASVALAASAAAPGAGGGDDTEQIADLYRAQCASCHGVRGDGRGIVAEHLHPPPRDFTRGKFRLVSTQSGSPSENDLVRVITEGMPGSAMPAFAQLSADDRAGLARHVRALAIEGLAARLADAETPSGEAMGLDEATREAVRALEPGEPFAVPEAPRSTAASVLRGRRAFVESCVGCHGWEGRGDGEVLMRTDEGATIRPRDLTRGIFKGDDGDKALFTRIRLGMPGSRMPAYTAEAGFTDRDVWDMVHYIKSICPPEARSRHGRRSHEIAVGRVKTAPTTIDDPAWKLVRGIRVNLTPLVWRDDAPEAVMVRALHDGERIAIVMSWEDATRSDHRRPREHFYDASAVQFSSARTPPFFAMGADGRPVSIWAFRANADGQIERLATELVAAGPVTLTERPEQEQDVEADARWRRRFWDVVFVRELGSKSPSDVVFAPGETTSAAFAVWDGARGDHYGQKSVSAWHWLVLEP